MSEHAKGGHRMEHGTGEKRDAAEIKVNEKSDQVGEEWSPSQDRKEHPDPETSPDDGDRARGAKKT